MEIDETVPLPEGFSMVPMSDPTGKIFGKVTPENLAFVMSQHDKGPFADGSYERRIPSTRGAPEVIITYAPTVNESREFEVRSVRICTDPHTILKV